MKLIAESGATKTDWRLIADDRSVRCASTAGLNPSVLDADQIRAIIAPVMPELNPEGRSVEEIHFYGAGLVSAAAAAVSGLTRYTPASAVPERPSKLRLKVRSEIPFELGD